MAVVLTNPGRTRHAGNRLHLNLLLLIVVHGPLALQENRRERRKEREREGERKREK
jgi:hypothetical protein